MEMNKLFRQWNVGADLSRPSPIYRPVMPDDAHGLIAYAPSSIAPDFVNNKKALILPGGRELKHKPYRGATTICPVRGLSRFDSRGANRRTITGAYRS
jgi:hypothetical protein